MARKVEFEIKLTINETEHRLLHCLGELAPKQGQVAVVSASRFSSLLNTSVATVRRSCESLDEMGLISKRGKVREDGGRDANEYVITLLGWEVLRSKGYMRPRHPEDELS